MIVLTFFRAMIIALANRVRGGLAGDISRFIRLALVGIAVAAEFVIYTNDLVLAALVFGITAGMFSFGWGSCMDLGDNELGYMDDFEIVDFVVGSEEVGWSYRQRFWRDFAGLSLRGLMITLIPGILAFSVVYALSGALMGAAYWLASKTPSTIKGFQRGPELGEVYFGLMIWAGAWWAATHLDGYGLPMCLF